MPCHVQKNEKYLSFGTTTDLEASTRTMLAVEQRDWLLFGRSLARIVYGLVLAAIAMRISYDVPRCRIVRKVCPARMQLDEARMWLQRFGGALLKVAG
jgi:hypothetical protein